MRNLARACAETADASGRAWVQAALFQHFYPEAGAALVRRFTEGLEASLGERRVSMALLQVRLAVLGVPLEPEIHGADPEPGSTLTGSCKDFQSNCSVNLRILGPPCQFYLA
jgi:hypothetical protein